MTTTKDIPSAEERRDALVGRLFEATLGAIDLAAVYIGDQLGFYSTLRDGGPATSAELAKKTGTSERYVREWLEQQAVSGVLEVEDSTTDAETRRYALPAGHDEALTEPESLAFILPLAPALVGCVRRLPSIIDAFRTGGGVPWEDYGADLRDAQAAFNRPAFTHLLGSDWIPAIPQVHSKLMSGSARVADVGCGGGWSSIAIAKAYPGVTVDGFDLDAPSIELAEANARLAGVGDQVRFHAKDVGDPSLQGSYDAAFAFECIHDMSQPVEVLASMRRITTDDGSVIVMDEKVAESFTAPGDEIERLMYGFSILCCLPTGMADQPSEGTGTVMRPATLRGYAKRAGFRDVEVLPIEHDMFRFYKLVK